MASIAIALYGHCCRRHVVGQPKRVVRGVSVVLHVSVEVFEACVLNLVG